MKTDEWDIACHHDSYIFFGVIAGVKCIVGGPLLEQRFIQHLMGDGEECLFGIFFYEPLIFHPGLVDDLLEGWIVQIRFQVAAQFCQ